MIRASDIVEFGAEHVEVELASDQRPFHGMLTRAQNVRQDGLYAERALNVDISDGVITARGGSTVISRAYGVTSAQVPAGVDSIPLKRHHGFVSYQYRSVRIVNVDGAFYEVVNAILNGDILELETPLSNGPYAAGSVVQGDLIGVIYRGMGFEHLSGVLGLYAEGGVSGTCRRTVAKIYDGQITYMEERYVEATASQSSTGPTIYLTRTHGFVRDDIVQIGNGDTFRRVSVVHHNRIVVSSSVSVLTGDRVRVVSRPADLRDASFIIEYGDLICGCTTSENRTSDTLSYGVSRPWCIGVLDDANVVMPLGIQPWKNTTGITVSASANANSELTPGAYEVRFTYVSGNGRFESEPSPRISVDVASGQGISVTITEAALSAEQHVTGIRVYRSYVNTPGVHYRVPIVRSSTEDIIDIPHEPGTFWITYGDITLGPQLRVGVNNPPPFRLASICNWEVAGRLCGAEISSSYLYYSDVPDITTGMYRAGAWPSTNYIKIGNDDPIMGLVSLRDGLLVIKSKSIWFVVGTPPAVTISQVYAREDGSAIGAISRTAIAVDEDVVFVLSQTGLYVIKRTMGFDGLSAVRLDDSIAGAGPFPTGYVLSDKHPRVYLLFNRHKKQLWIVYSRYAMVGSIIDAGGRESVEWVQYDFIGLPTGGPAYVGENPTCAYVAHNIAIFASDIKSNIPAVFIGYDESILMNNFGGLDAEIIPYASIYNSTWLRLPGIQRARLRRINTTCGVIESIGGIRVGCASDEQPTEVQVDVVQNRKNPIIINTERFINANEAPDAPSTIQAMVSIVGSAFQLKYMFSFGIYITRVAIAVQPLSPFGRKNTALITSGSEWAALP